MTAEEMNEQLLQQVNSLTATLAAQTELISQLNQTIQELKEQINKNSQNSSKPPSSDGFKKPSPKSLRKPSGKKAGGQEGHPGAHLAVIADPDSVIKHMPSACEGCPHFKMCKGTACVAERRHVIVSVNSSAPIQKNTTSCILYPSGLRYFFILTFLRNYF